MEPEQHMKCLGRMALSRAGSPEMFLYKKSVEEGKPHIGQGKPTSLPSGNGPDDNLGSHLMEVRPGHARVGSHVTPLIGQQPLSLFWTITLQEISF